MKFKMAALFYQTRKMNEIQNGSFILPPRKMNENQDDGIITNLK